MVAGNQWASLRSKRSELRRGPATTPSDNFLPLNVAIRNSTYTIEGGASDCVCNGVVL